MSDQHEELYAQPQTIGRPTVGVALFVSFALISVPPILFFGLWLSDQQRLASIQRFDNDAKLRAQSVEEGVRELIQLKREVLGVTAGTLSAMKRWDINKLQAITDAQIKSSGSFDSFYVGNPEGTSIVYAPSVRPDGTKTKAGVNYSDRDYYQELIRTKRVSIGKVKLGRQSKVANVHVAVPIYQDLDLKSEGPLRGFIIGGIKTSLIQQVMTRTLKGRDRFRAVLLESNLRVIADSDRQLSIFAQLPPEALFAQACQAGRSLEGLSQRGERLRALCLEVHIESLRWRLWISTPQELITAATSESISLTLKISLFLLIGVIIVAGLLSTWVSRLMRLISLNAQRVSSGVFHITLPKVRWFTPKEVVEVGNISLKTLARVREGDEQIRQLVRDLELVNQQQAPLAEAWRQVSEAIEILSPSGELLFVNPALFELLDLKRGEEARDLLGRPSQLYQVVDPASAPHSVGEAILSHARGGLSWSGEVECVLKGKRRAHDIHSSPIFDASGELVRVVVIRRDVSEERVAQASAAHNDRLAAIGTLAAGMAHEINNPMTYIKMSLDIIQESLDGAPLASSSARLIKEETYLELEDAVHDASEGIERVTEIVQSLLSIARSGGARGEGERMKQVTLSEVARACVNLVRSEHAKRVTFQVAVGDRLAVWGRRSELIQVLLNFLMNAAQAMPESRATGNLIRVEGLELPTGEVQLIISDNAKGIPEEDLERIFEPFFSSKPVGKGTGLGLSVSRGILEAHQASVEVSSTLDVGTRFTLTFPALSSFPEAVEPTNVLSTEPLLSLSQLQQSLDPARRRRVLIVDDDVLVAKSLAKMLREEQPVVVSSGREALKELETQPFDLILSDVMMPEMDGPTLFREVSARFPDYVERFIFISGAAKGSATISALHDTGRPILKKPISKQSILSTLDQYSLI